MMIHVKELPRTSPLRCFSMLFKEMFEKWWLETDLLLGGFGDADQSAEG